MEHLKLLSQMERVRKFIFEGINSSDNAGEVSKAFFVAHNAVSKEVIFAYTSGDAHLYLMIYEEL